MPTDANKQEKKQLRKQHKHGTKEKGRRKQRRRILPIWLRIIIVLFLSALALLVGLIVGYGVIGDGNPLDALDWSTWERIWNLITKTQ
ncbi:DNA-directed RNA polymerase subunit beta [Halobacillus shinanisalinarum]|uniref:DNA-directed RNA polymerase subunit beta n=1 Tax=Halobacillus shinanisalinarum TaxID=2932258 RepID=A0ABY4H4V8_9BACI|nr:DNA-directed RNA polymerase subunit beta [Halobacillus shinanisalinarum]UOQ94940.1 DNA-directed RNA polymerase subunit beta [Halobacillus shinanisalinarum]